MALWERRCLLRGVLYLQIEIAQTDVRRRPRQREVVEGVGEGKRLMSLVAVRATLIRKWRPTAWRTFSTFRYVVGV